VKNSKFSYWDEERSALVAAANFLMASPTVALQWLAYNSWNLRRAWAAQPILIMPPRSNSALLPAQ
jgi:hypothetical protein